MLQTMRGELTVPEACKELSIGEARFHAMRNQWLQEALNLLEPRRIGRPPRPPAPPAELERAIAELKSENQDLRQQLKVAEVRRELGEALPHVVAAPADKARKKNAARRRRRKNPSPR